jgi:SAM-dependent methyltransferase
MNPQDRLNKDKELERYLKHQNNYEDQRYKDFLIEIAKPCFEYVNKKSRCLDYGSGQEQNMERLFSSYGFKMESYDPYFYPMQLIKKYDLIVCNEVCEHFYNPAFDIKNIRSVLASQGVLAVGTNLRDESITLNSWHYLSDQTHVSIYSKKTFEYIASTYGFEILKVLNSRVVVLKAFT